ncbi:hypothetical protein [Actinomadura bangladeshensis]|uniref:Uncharacterized protein n=1 Tax=Actinomadura bangladeshensis TaxID=453573 RepID=A0A4R4P4V5_9ACTN|nr:hypothetical protein [Actinomadura bangladeshensis]TDC17418.1 hypothetical protein E1284_09170 [Actinomadura bangladeshensis]
MSIEAPVWASIITGTSAFIVGTVTYFTQRYLAHVRIRVDSELKLLDIDLKHFEALLQMCITAANSANRYILATPDIDVTNWEERKEYILPIVDSLGPARAELEALGEFEGRGLVKEALDSLEKMMSAHNAGTQEIKVAWKPGLLAEAIYAVSRARRSRLAEVGEPLRKNPRRFLRGH